MKSWLWVSVTANAILVVICLALLAKVTWYVRLLGITDQVEIFNQMHKQCLASDDLFANASNLNYALNYYPAGMKQDRGSLLGSIVEHAREITVRAIIQDFKIKSGKNLGDDPLLSIEEYSVKAK